jgi:hypothetical protein
MSIDPLRLVRLAAEQSSGLYSELQIVGRAVGSIASLGAVLGLIAAALCKTIFPGSKISYGEWIGYAGALAGLFSMVVEITNMAA